MASRDGFLEDAARELALMKESHHPGTFIWASKCTSIEIVVKPCERKYS